MRYHPLPWRLSRGYKTVAVMDANNKCVMGSLLMRDKPGDEETYAFVVGAVNTLWDGSSIEGMDEIFQTGRESK